MREELIKLNTRGYNSDLDKLMDNKVDVYLKAKLTKRLTYGEYVGEPNNGFELLIGDEQKTLNLDNVDVFTCKDKPSLTDDQQVVLEWLKKSCNADDYTTPMLAIYKLYSSQQMAPPTVRLSKEEQYQVLAAFAEWGLKEDNQ